MISADFSTYSAPHRGGTLRKLFGNNAKEKESRDSSYVAQAFSFACSNMARKKTGALIVIEEEISLEPYVHTGRSNADVNSSADREHLLQELPTP